MDRGELFQAARRAEPERFGRVARPRSGLGRSGGRDKTRLTSYGNLENAGKRMTAGARIRSWWKHAGAAQANAMLFLVYYTVLAPFAFLIRRHGSGNTPRGWVPDSGEPGNRLDSLRRQH